MVSKFKLCALLFVLCIFVVQMSRAEPSELQKTVNEDGLPVPQVIDNSAGDTKEKLMEMPEFAKMKDTTSSLKQDVLDNINVRDENGFTPLALAVKSKRDSKYIKKLLEAGADLTLRYDFWEYEKNLTILEYLQIHVNNVDRLRYLKPLELVEEELRQRNINRCKELNDDGKYQYELVTGNLLRFGITPPPAIECDVTAEGCSESKKAGYFAILEPHKRAGEHKIVVYTPREERGELLNKPPYFKNGRAYEFCGRALKDIPPSHQGYMAYKIDDASTIREIPTYEHCDILSKYSDYEYKFLEGYVYEVVDADYVVNRLSDFLYRMGTSSEDRKDKQNQFLVFSKKKQRESKPYMLKGEQYIFCARKRGEDKKHYIIDRPETIREIK